MEINSNNLNEAWAINSEETDILNTLFPSGGEIGSNRENSIPLLAKDSMDLVPIEISGYGYGDWPEVEILAEDLEISSNTDILGISEEPLVGASEFEGDRLLGPPAIPKSLEVGALSTIAEEAINQWSDTELGRSLPMNWDEVVFEVADLPGAILGQVQGNSVIIDSTAAGYGWFVDETPWENTEFDLSGTDLKAEEGSPAEGKIDLLTVVAHELGHFLGLDDLASEGELMSGSLGVGDRRLPSDTPITMEFIPEEELSLPHNLVVGNGVKNALVSGINTLAEELDSYSEDLGNQLLASIPGLLKDGGEANPDVAVGFLGEFQLGELLKEQLSDRLDTGLIAQDIADFIDDLDTTIGNLQINFNEVSSTSASGETVLDFTVDLEFSDNYKLDLGRNADLFGIEIDLDTSADVLLNSTASLDLTLGVVESSNDFFLRDVNLDATADINSSNINLDLKVGFLEAKVESGSMTLDADVSANLKDPNNSDGLNRITLQELQDTATDVIINVTPTGNFQMNLPVKVEGVPGLEGDLGTTIEVDIDAADLFSEEVKPDGSDDQRSAIPISVNDTFENLLSPFTNISSGDIIGWFRQLGSELGQLELSDALNFTVPFTDGTSLGELLGLSESVESGLTETITDTEESALFNSVQSLVELLESVGVELNFDKATGELTFDISLDGSDAGLEPIDVPIGFDVDLGKLAGFQTNSDASITLTPDVGLDFTLGVDLNEEGTPVVAIAAFNDESNFVLASDAVFNLKVGDNAPVAIIVEQTNTQDNTTFSDLVTDVENALGSVDVSVRAVTQNNQGFFLSTEEAFLQITDVNNEAASKLGLQEGQTAARIAMLGNEDLVDADGNSQPIVLPSNGVLPGDATLTIQIDDRPTEAITISRNASNTSIADLIEDINAEFNANSNLAGKVWAGVNGDRLVIALDGEDAKQLTVRGTNDVAREIGIPENGIVQARKVIDFFIEDAVLDGSLNIAGNELDTRAEFGFVGLNIKDIETTDVKAEFGIDFQNALGEKRFNLSELFDENQGVHLGVILTADNTLPGSGVLSKEATFDLKLGEETVSVTVTPDSNNQTTEDLIADIQSAVNTALNDAEIDATVEVKENEGKLVLSVGTLAGLTMEITDANNIASNNLGLKKGLSASQDPLIDWSGEVALKEISVDAGVTGLELSGLEVPIAISNSSIFGLPKLTPDFSSLSDLTDFGELSFSKIVGYLDDIALFLTENFEQFEFLNDDLPLIGISVNDFLGYIDEFQQVVNDFQENPGGTVQELNVRLAEALGLPEGSDLVAINYEEANSVLTVDLNFGESFTKSLPVNLDLAELDSNLSDALKLQGSAGLEAEGNANAKFSIGIDLSDENNPVSFLNLPNTEISVELAAKGEDLAFSAGLGPLSASVRDGAVTFDKDGNAETEDFASLEVALIDPTPGDDRILFSEISQIDAELKAEGGLTSNLPIFFPTESNHVGDIEFSVSDLPGFLKNPTKGENFDYNFPDLSGITDNLQKFSLLDKINLAVEGVDLFLAGLQNILDGEIFGLELPLIGDNLSDASEFIGDLRRNIYDTLRDTVDNVAKSPELIQESLFELLNSENLQLLKDSNGDGNITAADIEIVGDPANDNFVQWEMTLGGTVQLDRAIDFDFGIPALALDAEGNVELGLDWELDLGFGLNEEQGFYFILNDEEDNPELEVDLDLTIPDSKLTGSLAFLKLEIEDNKEEGGDKTKFNASFDIDLSKSKGSDNPNKVGLFEIDDMEITPSLTGGADVNLDLTASVNGELFDNPELSGVFPGIVSDFDLVWNFDASNLSKDKDFATLETVAFNNVSLDLGSFISDFLGPVAKEVQKVTRPIQPVIDAVTDPIPVISDLAGKDISLLDLAEAFGYAEVGMIEDIANIIELVNAIPTDAENLLIPLGDLELVGQSGGTNRTVRRSSSASSNAGFNYLDDIANIEDINNFPGVDLQQTDGIDGFINNSSGQTQTLLQGLQNKQYGAFDFPILSDPGQVFGLLLGKPAVLVTYDMSPLEFDFEYSQDFPIFGPLWGRIGGGVGANIDLAFGFDTYGIQKFAETDYEYPLDILRGFYVSDGANPDGSGADVPELVLNGSLYAGALINIAVAKLGVTGGIYGNIDFNLNDPDSDGRVRIEEILNNIYLGANSDESFLTDNPITAVFDISGQVVARLKWFIEILFVLEEEGQIGPDLPILDFDLTLEREEVLASQIGGGELRLNAGNFAGDRLHQNTEDAAENFTIRQEGGNIIVSSFGNTQTYEDVTSIVVESGDGDDVLVFDNVSVPVEIDAGPGNDFVDFRGSDSSNVTVIGGLGDDTVHGGGGSDSLLGGKGTDHITGGGGEDFVDGGEGADILSGDSGNPGQDTIYGGDGDDTIGGGGNTDYIDAGAGNDIIWGDSSYDEIDTRTNAPAGTEAADTIVGGEGKDTIYGEGGTDLIGGGIDADVIDGNSGEDEIWGDSEFEVDGTRIAPLPREGGRDTISGGEDGDLIYGENGSDYIHGNAGNDTVEGGFGTDTIYGDEDNDLLYGQGDADLIFGNAGDDQVIGQQGNDVLFGDSGTAGDTTILTEVDVATDGNDTIDGGSEEDIAFGGAGDDLVIGDEAENNEITGKDVLIGDGGRVIIEEYQFKSIETIDPEFGGNDEIIASSGDDIAFGGAGNDVMHGAYAAAIAVNEEASDADIMLGDNGKIAFVDGEVTRIETTEPATGGNDSIKGNEGEDAILGGAGNDSISGNQDRDIVLGDNGVVVRDDGSEEANDVFSTFPGNNGEDYIEGNEGDDLLIGGDGSDTISGNDGEDVAAGDHAYIQRNAENIVERTTTIAEDVGGNDSIEGNAGDDMLMGGFGDDIMEGNADNDIILGDNGRVVENDGSEEANDIISQSPEFGGEDTISGNEGNDIIIGGSGGNDTTGVGGDLLSGNVGDDVVVGDNAQIIRDENEATEKIETIFPTDGGDDSIEGNEDDDALVGGFGIDTIQGGEGKDIGLGDNGKFDYTIDGDLENLNLVSTTDPTAGHRDFIFGGNGNDMLFGGTDGDEIRAGADNDLVFGDHGKAEGVIDLAALPLNQEEPPFTFTAIDILTADQGGNELIHGDEGDDIILGQQGEDTLYGDDGEDDIIGGHNVAGGHDETDYIDGGEDDDAIAGDNASILRRPDALSPRMRSLSGEVIYDAEGNALVTDDAQTNPDATTERDIQLLDHTATTDANKFGADIIAGGADNDIILGQLGEDKIQGDSSIAETISATDPSVSADSDGDDYIEGGGDEDLIFGNSGRDDIIGDSSSLFGNDTAEKRPAGKDLIFGDSGLQTERNDVGDQSAEGHSRDNDVIIGDNGNIYRIVGTNGTDSGAYLTFTYDSYSNSKRLVPRAVELLDYIPGGDANLGADDLIYGEAGDDEIYGMTGNDVIFGNAQDDNIMGGVGHDRIYGGTGEDGILGDDGLILINRNGETETLYGIDTATQQSSINLPGPFIGAVINISDRLNKQARLLAFESGGNDVIYGGLGDDFLHGGAEDDAISGAEALANFYNADPVSDFNPLRYDPETRKLFAYDAENPRVKIEDFLLNFEAIDETGEKIDDGKDRIFGDLGNDWLVGGTRNDRMFGGLGDDLLNADDNHDSNDGLNNRPDDPEFADADFAYGGGGLDVMIANTGGDRLFDWSGEFNSFLVPFSPFGQPTIVRAPSPHVVEFLFELGQASGSDRNLTEPYGELGLVTQKDDLWGEQQGAPRDPQPGNIPGVQRDTQGSPEEAPTRGNQGGNGNGNQPSNPGNSNQGNGNGNNQGNNQGKNNNSDEDQEGSGFDDVLIGGQGANALNGLGGADYIDGRQGDDALDGGSGKDSIKGGAGDDSILAGEDDDVVNGGSGKDSVKGGAGNDEIAGDANNDLLEGEAGDDAISGGAGADVINGGLGNDLLGGDAGHDTIDGEEGDDLLLGDSGNDELFGGEGEDTLVAKSGNNVLDGGLGSDRLYGGSGRDTFVLGVGRGPDIIYNYDERKDTLSYLDGLKKKDISSETDPETGDTIITYKPTGEVLAILKNETAEVPEFVLPEIGVISEPTLPTQLEEEEPNSEVPAEDEPVNEVPEETESPTESESPVNEVPEETESPTESESPVNEVPEETESPTESESPVNEVPEETESPTESESPVNEVPETESPTESESPVNEVPEETESPTESESPVNEVPETESPTESESPVNEVPETESPTESESPVNEVPETESPTESESPVNEVPETESPTESESPVNEVPETESPTESESPVNEVPQTPAPEAPVNEVPQTPTATPTQPESPVNEVPQTPAPKQPESPVNEVPQTPTATPTQPESPVNEVPQTPTQTPTQPESPVNEVPQTPTATPTQPESPVNEVPEETESPTAPESPVNEVPEETESPTAPESPVNEVPEETESPTAPESPVNEVPQTPESESPVNEVPETEEPVNEVPETEEPESPVNEVPQTEEPTESESPVNEVPQTEEPTESESPVNEVPQTEEPTESESPVNEVPQTEEPESPVNEVPQTEEPTESESPVNEVPQTEEPESPVNEVPETDEPTESESPVNEVPQTEEPESPVNEVPETDEPTAPESPVNEVPETDEPTEPESPVNEVPETDEPTAPESPVNEVPETDEPTESEEPVNEVPETESPTESESPVNEVPETEEPESPVNEVPQTEEPTESESPVNEVPEAEEPTESEEPVNEVPQTEEPTAPESPVASEQPLVEQPAAAGPIGLTTPSILQEEFPDSPEIYTVQLPAAPPLPIIPQLSPDDLSDRLTIANFLIGQEESGQHLGSDRNDWIGSFDGHDFIAANRGSDIINAGFGNDTLHGGKEGDLINGENGDDLIYGDLGPDTLFGQQGNDTIYGDNDNSSGNANNNDLIYGGEGNDLLNGNRGNDLIQGGEGNDTQHGGKGDDFIEGGAGDDVLRGDKGNDILSGGIGDNTLTGGSGSDRFVLTAGASTNLITDFTPGIDSIELIVEDNNVTLDRLVIETGESGAILKLDGEIVAILEDIDADSITLEDLNLSIH
ncbi:MAG: hypothetical protein F6K40_08385 [Okeania sp. SIO3I5]|uniref:hypothetical protein n=1 Tax=Okeania sp. SIO3I5 TaxID=2607805 RepID=UPI0013B63398|nr:hypothetical protein [Okeania sp. SIO3I5]NEQ36297.1 hypothetical protein [Okeania sp. SIO3I5]